MNLLSDEGLVKLGFSKRIIKSCNLLKKWHKKNQLISFKSFNWNINPIRLEQWNQDR